MPRKTILLSDAADILTALEESFLIRDGFLLMRVGTGREAFALAEERDPALVVLDLALPGMAECRRRMETDSLLRATPVVLVLPPGAPHEGDSSATVIRRPLQRRPFLQAACRLLGIVTRAAPRLPADLPVRYGAAEGRLDPGRTADINGGGLYLCGGPLFPVHTEIRFAVALAPGVEVSGRGRVAWVNHPEWNKKTSLPPGMGIQFLQLEGEGEARLRQWLAAAGYQGVEGG